ncbi:aminoglycoside phosphotransferase family protein [Paenibacillus sp. FSL K6-1096]|uniref:phosphotransferase enzyme family protein n=1 Tax=Paenibacillus sp. FSL K6-1096 TaxID=2921460 RepID=UPI0030EC1371
MNQTNEERLTGGNVNELVRIGDTVRRPTGYWSPNVHELLLHLEQQEFAGAPRFFGLDEEGREIVSFLPGEVAGNDYPELAPYMWSDRVLTGIARLLRRYHDATQGFVPKADRQWQHIYTGAEAQEVICHNDAAPYNMVFQHEQPVALIDFDTAGPGPRMWDIAYSLYTSVPLAGFAPDYATGSTVAYDSGLHGADRGRRISLFFEAYGLPVPEDLQSWVIRRLHAMCDTLRKGAAEGHPAFVTMVEEGHLAHYEREIEFVSSHYGEWISPDLGRE